MNLGKKARLTASITNNTKIYGIMGGTVPLTGKENSLRSHLLQKATTFNIIPTDPLKGLEYMTVNKLLSVNPQASGGAGKKSLMFSR